ncbi:MAG: Flp pilus assembly protein CpaB [Elusimicrobia bacterium]|nr:Flp pilus assembly protein CpaB [Elusimicrobiota bacterium]
MQKKNMLLPLLLALFASIFFFLWLRSKEIAITRAYETAQVIVARRDIPERTVLTRGLLETQTLPRKYIQQDAFEVRSPADIKQVENLVSKIRIPKGNQVTAAALLTLSPEAGLSLKVPPGYRGMVLPVENDLLQLIKPGDRADILVTFDALMADGRKEKVTATILQNILVLGVGINLGQGMAEEEAERKKKTEVERAQFREKGALSVALNPNESQYLALALLQGNVQVVVRGVGDAAMHPIEMASFRKLFR